jgi:hypothetical protein
MSNKRYAEEFKVEAGKAGLSLGDSHRLKG